MNNRGYTKIPNAIIRMATISPSERSAWCLIASLPNGYELSVNDACAMLGINQKTWRQCVAVLVKRNMVTVESVPGHANVYSVTPAENWDITPSKNWYSQKTEGVPKNGTPPLPKNGRGTHSYNKEQLNNIDDDARTRVREEVMSDAMVEMGCMSLGIDRGTYENLAFQVFTDWDFQNLPDGEWTKTHFLAVMRYKVADHKKSNNNGQRTNQNGNIPVQRVSGFKILNKA